MKKYIITITLFCLSLFLIDNAYALEGDYSSSNFQIFTYSSPDGGTRTSSGYSSGLNVSHNLNGGYLEGLYIQVFGSDSIVYKAGNTYTFHFRVNFNPKKWSYLDNSYTTSRLETYGSTTASSSGMSMDNITSSSLSITNIDGNTYQMNYIFKVVPETDLKYVMFKCFYPYGLMGADLEFVYAMSTVRVVDLTVTYQEGLGAIMDGQTIVIQNQTDKIVDTQKETNEKLDETNKELGEMNDNLTNDDTTGATDSASGFFEGFTTDTFGLTSIITAPLNLIKSITSKTCTPLNLEVPFVNKNMQLPCMTTIYTNYFGSFLTVYQTITFGIISYWVCIRIFALVKDFKNPDHDEIEVMDL